MKLHAHIYLTTDRDGVEKVNRSRLLVRWEDAEYHYHINLTNDDKLPPRSVNRSKWLRDDFIHRNAKPHIATDDHAKDRRTLDLHAAKYASIREEIKKLLTPKNIEAAIETAVDTERMKQRDKEIACSNKM